ncbi:MAG: FimB/Mfa2 family fimbrial subunit [Rikenellaceae bacterium]|nr:FimB/Mfa2 family fimbrial subunit [Rikenellaceae bacterium]
MKHRFHIALLLAALFVAACRKESPYTDVQDRTLTFRIGEDAHAVDDDNKFSNLYLFFFDEGGNNVRSYYREMTLTSGYTTDLKVPENFTGSLTVIANYNSSSLDRQILLSMNRSGFWGMMAHKSLGFSPNQLPMVKEVEVGPNDEEVEVQLERLVARIDLHLFAEDMDPEKVKVKSVTLRNQLVGTALEAGKMPGNFPRIYPYPGAQEEDAVKDAATPGELKLLNPALAPEPQPGEEVEYGIPAIRAYSFQYVPDGLPQGVAAADYAPQLDIVLDVDGVEVKRSCYVTREVPANAATPQYGLLRNYVYRVHAVIRPVDIAVRTDVFDWIPGTEQEVEWDDVSTASFTCTPVGGASNELSVKYGIDENSGRITQRFTFKISSPKGRRWTASLTNSTDFELVDDEVRGIVSSGIVGQAPGSDSGDTFVIEVRALKEYTGGTAQPVTYLSIAMQEADGVSYSTLVVNPDGTYAGGDLSFKIVQESN